MIIGNGLVAAGFSPYAGREEFLIFASGVSNSKSSTREDFRRESELLVSSLEKNPTRRAVYFSSTSVYDPDLQRTPYIKHKLEMEGLVQRHAARYHILRLSNLAGISNNPNTLLNFLYSRIVHNEPFELWKNSERNIMDLADVFQIADHILKNDLFLNRAINIANEKNYPLTYIVKCIEAYVGERALFTEKEKGRGFKIDISKILPIYRTLGIGFGENYLSRLLEKYYPENEL